MNPSINSDVNKRRLYLKEMTEICVLIIMVFSSFGSIALGSLATGSKYLRSD